MASPQTVVRGNDTSTATYTLAPGVFQYIESVLVVVDNSGGGDIRPTLFVTTQDGQVIATKRQGETIPAGDSGTATWALRLTDESAATPDVSSDLLYAYTLTVDQNAIDTGVDGPMAGPLPATFETLAIWTLLGGNSAAVGIGANAQLIVNNDTTATHYAYMLSEQTGANLFTGGAVRNVLPNFRITGAAADVGAVGVMRATMPGYTSPFWWKMLEIHAGTIQATGPDGFQDQAIVAWKDQSAVDRLAVRAQGANLLRAGSQLVVTGAGRIP